MPPIDARPADIDYVLRVLARCVPQCEVRAFGSRVAMTAKPFSDLDLAIVGQQPIAAEVLADLNGAFRESSLPFKVDVVDWATADEWFRRIVERQYVVLQESRQ